MSSRPGGRSSIVSSWRSLCCYIHTWNVAVVQEDQTIYEVAKLHIKLKLVLGNTFSSTGMFKMYSRVINMSELKRRWSERYICTDQCLLPRPNECKVGPQNNTLVTVKSVIAQCSVLFSTS